MNQRILLASYLWISPGRCNGSSASRCANRLPLHGLHTGSRRRMLSGAGLDNQLHCTGTFVGGGGLGGSGRYRPSGALDAQETLRKRSESRTSRPLKQPSLLGLHARFAASVKSKARRGGVQGSSGWASATYRVCDPARSPRGLRRDALLVESLTRGGAVW